MQRELKMASAHEKIMRRHFKFVAKIIKKSPSLSPERMMMGSPKLIWQRDVFEVELKPDTWNPAHGKTKDNSQIFGRSSDTIVLPCIREKGRHRPRRSKSNYKSIT